MIRSANEIASGSRLEADVCIVGCGPAGLTLARELAGASFKVLVVESGEFRTRRDLKALNEGEAVGDSYPNPRWQRVRQVGGCANRWLVDIGGRRMGARFAPLDPVDFEQRDWMPNSGWPITRVALESHYQRAHQHCGIGPNRYHLDAGEAEAGSIIETPAMETSLFRFGPQTAWTGRHDDLFGHASNVELLVNATVTEIRTRDHGAAVAGLQLVNDAGRRVEVRAKLFVLAVGCIETARLLLCSRDAHAQGIGNGRDIVGRYFMDHPQSYLNTLRPSDRGLFDRLGIFDLAPCDNGAVMAKLCFKQSALREQQLPNSCHLLFPRHDRFLSDGFQAFFSLALDVRHRSLPREVLARAARMGRGARDLLAITRLAMRGKAHYPYLSRGGWRQLKGKRALFDTFEIWSMVEQSPSPENRVRLASRRDRNGMPLVEINWRFTEADRDGVNRLRASMKGELEAAGLGRVDWSAEPYSTPSSVHPIGGARMGDAPRTSVVTSDLAVHDVANLYIASSAVFPTSGYANPTLTVVALACRLADRIKHILAAPVVTATPAVNIQARTKRSLVSAA